MYFKGACVRTRTFVCVCACVCDGMYVPLYECYVCVCVLVFLLGW